ISSRLSTVFSFGFAFHNHSECTYCVVAFLPFVSVSEAPWSLRDCGGSMSSCLRPLDLISLRHLLLLDGAAGLPIGGGKGQYQRAEKDHRKRNSEKMKAQGRTCQLA